MSGNSDQLPDSFDAIILGTGEGKMQWFDQLIYNLINSHLCIDVVFKIIGLYFDPSYSVTF